MTKNINPVQVTGENYTYPDEIAFAIEIFRDIFPKKIEEKYVELANLVFQYMDETTTLTKSGRSIDKLGANLDRIKQKQTEAERELEKLQTHLNELKKKLTAGTILPQDIIELYTRTASFATIIMPKSAQKTNEIEQEYDKNRMDAGNAHVNIDNLIIQIKNKLKEINELSINGIDRLDNIRIDDKRHLSKLEEKYTLTENIKINLKELFHAYYNMRIATFKSIIDQAHEICFSYKNHEIITYINQNDPRVTKQHIIDCSLMDLSYDFLKILTLLLQDSKILGENSIIKTTSHLIKTMNIYTSYLTGDIENINVDTINDLIRTNTYTCPRALTALANIVKPAVLNNHQRK